LKPTQHPGHLSARLHAVIALRRWAGSPAVTFYDASGGGAVPARAPDGHAMLVDAGESRRPRPFATVPSRSPPARPLARLPRRPQFDSGRTPLRVES
jgi:hypothetical protein